MNLVMMRVFSWILVNVQKTTKQTACQGRPPFFYLWTLLCDSNWLSSFCGFRALCLRVGPSLFYLDFRERVGSSLQHVMKKYELAWFRQASEFVFLACRTGVHTQDIRREQVLYYTFFFNKTHQWSTPYTCMIYICTYIWYTYHIVCH